MGRERDIFVSTLVKYTRDWNSEGANQVDSCDVESGRSVLEASWVDVPLDLAESLIDFPDGTIGHATATEEGWVHL